MHDTSEPFGDRDDNEYYGDYSEYPTHIDRSKRGLWPAVEDFLKKHPEWTVHERYYNNHGFTVLKRVGSDDSLPSQRIVDSRVEDVLKNKIILCTGPSLRRKERLKLVTELDFNKIPFKKIFVSTNDPSILDIDFYGRKPDVQLIPDRGHQLDCLNAIITTIKRVIQDPDCKDDDIILFKHETVYINDMNLVKQAIKKLIDGYDMVSHWWHPGGFYCTDVFYLKVRAARNILRSLNEVTALERFDNCEKHFTADIANLTPKVYKIAHDHWIRKENELGFYHISPRGQDESCVGMWDKKNYDELYKKP
jgi:hypothetical protein